MNSPSMHPERNALTPSVLGARPRSRGSRPRWVTRRLPLFRPCRTTRRCRKAKRLTLAVRPQRQTVFPSERPAAQRAHAERGRREAPSLKCHRAQTRSYAMTATPSIDLPAWMVEQLSQASPDLLRQMVQTFAEALMSADADAVCGAGYGQRSPDRSNTRNGYRHRGWDTRAGSIDLGHPQATGSDLLPGVAARAASSGRVRPGQRGGHLLSARGVHVADGEAGRAARHHPAVQVAGQRDGQRSRRPGRGVPDAAVGRRALHLRRC